MKFCCYSPYACHENLFPYNENMRIGIIWDLFKETFEEWINDQAPRLGASLAFYTVLSIGPLLLLALAAAGVIFGHDAAQGRVVEQIQGIVGAEGARAIQDMIVDSAEKKDAGLIATLAGLGALLFGASGAFGQLQDAMNTIWNVHDKRGRGLGALIRKRFFSFTMVLGTGFLLLVSLVINATLAGITQYASGYLADIAFVMQFINSAVSLGVVTLLFALIFKYVPDIMIDWRDVWIGAFLTAVMFTFGKYCIGLYLGRSSLSSSYGAAGSLVVVLVWVYYSAQILFFGAEFTQVYSRRRKAA